MLPGINQTPKKRARDGRPQRVLLGRWTNAFKADKPTYRRLAPLDRIVHHVALKRAFNVVKIGVRKMMFAMRADVLLYLNEQLLRAMLAHDVFVNVAFIECFQ